MQLFCHGEQCKRRSKTAARAALFIGVYSSRESDSQGNSNVSYCDATRNDLNYAVSTGPTSVDLRRSRSGGAVAESAAGGAREGHGGLFAAGVYVIRAESGADAATRRLTLVLWRAPCGSHPSAAHRGQVANPLAPRAATPLHCSLMKASTPQKGD